MVKSFYECGGMMKIYATFKPEYIFYRHELYNSFMGAMRAHTRLNLEQNSAHTVGGERERERNSK